MKVGDFLNVLNMQVKYKITDRMTKEDLTSLLHVRKTRREIFDKNIYMVFQENDTLNITVY